MSISKHLNPRSSALAALTAAVALVACSKGGADRRASDNVGGAASPTAPGTAAPPTAPVATTAPATPHGGHEAAHGGLVLMDAHNHHFELALDPGRGSHQLYVSDDGRAPLPASTFDKVQITVKRPGAAAEELALKRSADDTRWEATGAPVPTTGAAVALSYDKGGERLYQVEVPVEYVLTGEMPGGNKAPASPGDHAHAAPHGGMVKTTSGGHIELVANASGAFQVWLLDEQSAPRPVAGVSVKIMGAAKGYADVVATAKGDHFEGAGAAIPGDHAAAVVTATIGGTTETARFELHLEADGPAGGPDHEAAAGHDQKAAAGHDHETAGSLDRPTAGGHAHDKAGSQH